MERCVTDPDNGLLFLAVEVTDESTKEKLNLVIIESTNRSQNECVEYNLGTFRIIFALNIIDRVFQFVSQSFKIATNGFSDL